MSEKDVDLLPLLTKGLYSELMCVKLVPILRMYLVFRQLRASESADALLYLICQDACVQRVHGPGERVAESGRPGRAQLLAKRPHSRRRRLSAELQNVGETSGKLRGTSRSSLQVRAEAGPSKI